MVCAAHSRGIDDQDSASATESTYTNNCRTKEIVSTCDDPDRPPHVDLVFTYVNGSDPEWQSVKQEFEDSEHFQKLQEKNGPSKSSDASKKRRFAEHDELRIAIRSANMHMDWIRCIYIVVAQESQTPAWFNENQDKVEIVYHKDIFKNEENLPTYNSHAIEAAILGARGARFFVYANDDMNVVSKVTREEIVDLDTCTVKPLFKSNAIGEKETLKMRHMAYSAANINNRKLLEAVADEEGDDGQKILVLKHKPQRYPAHVMIPLDRDIWKIMMKNRLIQQAIRETTGRHYRNIKDNWPIGLAQNFAYYRGDPRKPAPGEPTYIESDIKYCYIEVQARNYKRSRRRDPFYLKMVECHGNLEFDFGTPSVSKRKRVRHPDNVAQLECLNDVAEDQAQTENVYNIVQRYYQVQFDKRSPCEKGDQKELQFSGSTEDELRDNEAYKSLEEQNYPSLKKNRKRSKRRERDMDDQDEVQDVEKNINQEKPEHTKLSQKIDSIKAEFHQIAKKLSKHSDKKRGLRVNIEN